MFKKIIELNINGYIFSETLRNEKIPSVYLTRMCKKGMIKKIVRGIYILPNYIEDDLYINYLKDKDLIYTNSTSLYLQGLTQKHLEDYQVNFYMVKMYQM